MTLPVQNRRIKNDYYRNGEIIETYWNVNALMRIVSGFASREIIETYWNVNKKKSSSPATVGAEIIETYWNILKCK